MTEHILAQVKEDVEFLLEFMPATDPAQVAEGLADMFYVTGTYEGDVEIATRVRDIRERYEIVAQDDEEEDFEEVG